jgi:hypothetical protein
MTLTRPYWLALLALAACSPSASPARGQPADTARDQAPSAAVAGHADGGSTRGPGAPRGAEAPREPGASRLALPLLATLPVRERGPKLGYARDQYGPAWADTDRNGCDTRNDILHRDLGGPDIKPGTHDCVVLTGTLADPYTSTQIRFERGGASEVDVDHVVALGNAWVTGAADWPFKQRLALANDPLNLLAVEASANRAKSDGDAATWLPPNHAYRCAYVARQIAVKAKYGPVGHAARARGDGPGAARLPRRARARRRRADPRADQSSRADRAGPAGESGDPGHGSRLRHLQAGEGQPRRPVCAREGPRVRVLPGPRRRRGRLRVSGAHAAARASEREPQLDLEPHR